MFESYYKLEISGKDVKRWIKMLYRLGVRFEEIYFDGKKTEKCYVKVDEESYEKIKKVKTSYEIEILELYGWKKGKAFLEKNKVFLLSLFSSFLFLFFLSQVIFKVEIVHNDREIRTLLQEELKQYGISPFHFLRDYSYLQEVKANILAHHKDTIEWLEIEREGTKYTVRVEKRIIHEPEEEEPVKHIVAKKSGIVMKIVAEKGEVVKKINDYVKKGDIIISGDIYRNEEVVDHVSASGDVYAEVWYTVKVEMPLSYKEEKLTGRKKGLLNIKFLSSEWNVLDFSPYKNRQIQETVLFEDFFHLVQVRYHIEKEMIVRDEVNSLISEEFASNIAREKIESNLKENEYVISQKKLKTVINDSTIVTEVFFKVYENISQPEYFSVPEEESRD